MPVPIEAPINLVPSPQVSPQKKYVMFGKVGDDGAFVSGSSGPNCKMCASCNPDCPLLSKPTGSAFDSRMDSVIDGASSPVKTSFDQFRTDIPLSAVESVVEGEKKDVSPILFSLVDTVSLPKEPVTQIDSKDVTDDLSIDFIDTVNINNSISEDQPAVVKTDTEVIVEKIIDDIVDSGISISNAESDISIPVVPKIDIPLSLSEIPTSPIVIEPIEPEVETVDSPLDIEAESADISPRAVEYTIQAPIQQITVESSVSDVTLGNPDVVVDRIDPVMHQEEKSAKPISQKDKKQKSLPQLITVEPKTQDTQLLNKQTQKQEPIPPSLVKDVPLAIPQQSEAVVSKPLPMVDVIPSLVTLDATDSAIPLENNPRVSRVDIIHKAIEPVGMSLNVVGEDVVEDTTLPYEQITPQREALLGQEIEYETYESSVPVIAMSQEDNQKSEDDESHIQVQEKDIHQMNTVDSPQPRGDNSEIEQNEDEVAVLTSESNSDKLEDFSFDTPIAFLDRNEPLLSDAPEKFVSTAIFHGGEDVPDEIDEEESIQNENVEESPLHEVTNTHSLIEILKEKIITHENSEFESNEGEKVTETIVISKELGQVVREVTVYLEDTMVFDQPEDKDTKPLIFVSREDDGLEEFQAAVPYVFLEEVKTYFESLNESEESEIVPNEVIPQQMFLFEGTAVFEASGQDQNDEDSTAMKDEGVRENSLLEEKEKSVVVSSIEELSQSLEAVLTVINLGNFQESEVFEVQVSPEIFDAVTLLSTNASEVFNEEKEQDLSLISETHELMSHIISLVSSEGKIDLDMQTLFFLEQIITREVKTIQHLMSLMDYLLTQEKEISNDFLELGEKIEKGISSSQPMLFSHAFIFQLWTYTLSVFSSLNILSSSESVNTQTCGSCENCTNCTRN